MVCPASSRRHAEGTRKTVVVSNSVIQQSIVLVLGGGGESKVVQEPRECLLQSGRGVVKLVAYL